jgi:hypothetical protein
LQCRLKIGGYALDRLAAASSWADKLGQEVWFSPALFDEGPAATLRYIVGAVRRGEVVWERPAGKIVFCVGPELMLFLNGFPPGRHLLDRLNNSKTREIVRSGSYRAPLIAFLVQALSAVRQVFHGPVAYAALPLDGIDWAPFDVAGIDHYWDVRIQDRYLERLQPFLASGKPVVVTGTGSRAYQGVHSSGTLGLRVIDPSSQFFQGLPVVGRLFKPRLKGTYIRDEGEQADRPTAVLGLFDAAGVNGVFLDTFVDYLAPYSPDLHHDLDMSALSLVKTFEHGNGSTSPDRPWETKEAFRAVAAYYSK